MKLRKKYYDGLQVQDVISQCVDDYDTIMRILKKFSELPTADVVERKKGKWIDEDEMTCSVCGFECDDPYYLGDAKYCPNCGAQMDMRGET